MSLAKTRKASFDLLENVDLPTRKYDAGAEIIKDGAEAKEMYLLRAGKVAIKVQGETVAEIGPGGIFGEMGLIDHHSRSGTATAVEPCVVVPVDERLFVILVQDTPYFALDVMRTLVERIRAMNERLKLT